MTHTGSPEGARLIERLRDALGTYGDGFRGGPDKRKRDGKMLAHCTECANWQDEGHDEWCPFPLIQEALQALTEGETGRQQYPIPLNDAQERAAKEWAADDRLWTTQETVEQNLRTFARVILRDAQVLVGEADPRCPPPRDWQPIETAPKDGRVVILGNFAQQCLLTGAPHVWTARYWDHEDWRGWAECSYAATNENGEPTHWMSLPEPPPRDSTPDEDRT